MPTAPAAHAAPGPGHDLASLLAAFTDGYSSYAGSKSPVEHFTRAAAKEFGVRGINVNNIAPGPMDTPFFYPQETPERVEFHKSQAMGNRRHGPLAWRLVRERWEEFNERFPSNSIVRMVAGVRSIFDPATADDIAEFFAHTEVLQGTQSLAQHLEFVRVHQALRAAELADLAASLSER